MPKLPRRFRPQSGRGALTYTCTSSFPLTGKDAQPVTVGSYSRPSTMSESIIDELTPVRPSNEPAVAVLQEAPILSGES